MTKQNFIAVTFEEAENRGIVKCRFDERKIIAFVNKKKKMRCK